MTREISNEKGVPKIEVTPEMIEAGVLELRERMFGEPLSRIVESVYISMVIANSEKSWA